MLFLEKSIYLCNFFNFLDMSLIPNPKNSVGNAIKIYLFPALVTILATLIWRDVTEMRADVKALLAQSNIDKTDIQNLKRDVQLLDMAVFNKKIIAQTESKDNEDDKKLPYGAVVYRDQFYKPEEEYDVTKQLKS